MRGLLMIGLTLMLFPTSLAQRVRKQARIVKPSFAYTKTVFDFQEESMMEIEPDDVTIRDVNYLPYTPERGRIKAYIVAPEGRGPFAGVLFFHWLGEPHGDRKEFLTEAIALP
jgi:hypothetical protein